MNIRNITDFIDNTDKDHLIIAIDGRCASGKTTLASILAQEYDANLFHMDDFFLQPHQRTKERYATAGENVDHERFLEQVLLPLSKKEDVSYIRFDCQSLKLLEPVIKTNKRINIIEGSYSLRPDFRPYYDLKIFIDIDPKIQLQRLEKRNPERLQAFKDKWIPFEEKYFEGFQIRQHADMIITCND